MGASQHRWEARRRLRDYSPQPVRWLLALAIFLSVGFGSSAGASKPSVVFDGDSITVIGTPAIHKLLDPSYRVEVLAVEGERINQRLPALVSALKSHPFAVVENFGHE